MTSLDRFAVRPDGTVACPLRRRTVTLVECATCGHLLEVDPHVPPTSILCEAPYVAAFYGLDDEA